MSKAIKPAKTPNEVKQAIQTELMPATTGTDTTTIVTKEAEIRKATGKVSSVEKATQTEKDAAPQIIIQYTDNTGARRTKTFGCSSIRLSEYKEQTLARAGGPKTVINITIEAGVLEVS